MMLGFQVKKMKGQMTDSMKQPLKWVRKNLGFDEDVEDEVRDIMKTKEDALVGFEVRHKCSSLIYILHSF